MDNRCDTCRWWERTVFGDTHLSCGTCRRRSPRFRSQDESDDGHWPDTNDSDWCGEWQATETATVLDLRVMDNLDVSVRARRYIRSLGVDTLAELVECTSADLLDGCAKLKDSHIEEIIKALAKHSLQLAPSTQ